MNKSKKLGGKVVFATIATSSFREWNFHRYSINKTDVLKFYEDYDKMRLNMKFMTSHPIEIFPSTR
jgi:hypothetical protein